jgi:hypothetical protein
MLFIGLLVAGSTALTYHYFFVYGPPLEAAEDFMSAMESQDREALAKLVLMSTGPGVDDFRPATAEEIASIVESGFERGRILDQRTREGPNTSLTYLVWREPDGQVYALVTTEYDDAYRIVIPAVPESSRRIYLWDYAWTN